MERMRWKMEEREEEEEAAKRGKYIGVEEGMRGNGRRAMWKRRK